MKIFLITISSLFTSVFLLPKVAYAHCPFCVAGAGVGLTLSRLLGIDDTITGVWLGAFLGAISFWTEKPLFKLLHINSTLLRNILRPVLFGVIVFLTITSFYKFNLINRMVPVFGFDKLTFGMVGGSVVFYIVDIIDDFLIQKNGKVFFPYQRIIVSLGSIILLSVFNYWLINYVV